MVAVIAMIAVPVSQLRTISVQIECCCPDPTTCHCGDHDKAPDGKPAIKACHKSSDTFVSASSPEIVHPPAVAIAPPAERRTTLHFHLPSPHQPPSPPQPPGPS